MGDLVAAQSEQIDGCAGGQEVGLGTGFQADAGGVVQGRAARVLPGQAEEAPIAGVNGT
jgi:hypothetical protein